MGLKGKSIKYLVRIERKADQKGILGAQSFFNGKKVLMCWPACCCVAWQQFTLNFVLLLSLDCREAQCTYLVLTLGQQ
jgi:hypothetical protein